MPLAHDGARDTARSYLDSLALHGIKLGLNNIRELAEADGNPQSAYPVVHVAGTNGKGSTVAFLASILETAGYRVGRFTSPHLLDVTERFLVDGHAIAEKELCENINRFRAIAEDLGCVPTFFEMNTAVAFRWFAQKEVDIALVETGMGGRFDSTNIVTPLACAITNIDFDHMQYLGDTLPKIAFEKAGILKCGVPAVIGAMPSDALQVIEERANNLEAPLYCLGREFSVQSSDTIWPTCLSYRGLGTTIDRQPLGLSGPHQSLNAGVAVTLAALLKSHFPGVTDAVIGQGLQQARWPGRLEQVLEHPPVFMDVAHNPAGCAALARCFNKAVVVFSVSSDKDAASMLEILSAFAAPLILTEYQGERSLTVESLRQILPDKHFQSCKTLEEAIQTGMRQACEETPLVLTGSIYAAGEARRILCDTYGASTAFF